MKLSGVIDALISAGGSAEQILAVVRAAEIEQETDKAERRAKEAARKKAYREMVDAQKSRDVPRCPEDTDGPSGTNGTPDHTISSEEVIPPSPPMGAHPPRGRSSRQGSTIPSGWSPNSEHFDKAIVAGRDERWVLDQAEAMREWAESNSNRAVARKANWDRTFDGWMRREIGKQHVNGARAGPKQRPMSMFDATIDLLGEFHDKHH